MVAALLLLAANSILLTTSRTGDDLFFDRLDVYDVVIHRTSAQEGSLRTQRVLGFAHSSRD
jgi:hypothetical protein